MSVLGQIQIIESELWPQQDARDPLGVFGWRGTSAGDATGGSNKVTIEVPEAKRAAYVLKVWDMVIVQVVGTPVNTDSKLRILSNWPNIDAQAGIQAYGGFIFISMLSNSVFTAPFAGPANFNPFSSNWKDILIYDPSAQSGPLTIAEMEVVNIDATTYSFEGYGYYWDRAVMNTPGGPRNPGTS